MQIKQKPYHLLLLTGLVLFLTSFFVLVQNNIVNIHLHDTYIIIAQTHIFWLMAIMTLFMWTLYLLTNRILLSKTLTWAHVIVTIVAFVLIVLTIYLGNNLFNPQQPLNYNYSDWNAFKSYGAYNNTIILAISIFLTGQFIFVINFITGFFYRRKM